MNKLIRAAFMPHDPRLITVGLKGDSPKEKAVVQTVEQAAKYLKEANPQTVVIMTSQGITLPDAVTISMHPRLRGAINTLEAEVSLAFETDMLLIRNIMRKSDRLGVNLIDLTDDKAKSFRANLKLDESALVPLYFMHEAGFKGQIVQLACNSLAFEEVYTLGKAVQSAVDQVDKRVVVIASGQLGTDAKAQKFNKQVIQAVRDFQVKQLLSLDRAVAEQWGKSALRPLYFLMGALGGRKCLSQVLAHEVVGESDVCVATMEA